MLKCQKGKFSLPDDITYLNCAYRGPLMKHIEKIGWEAVSQNNNPALIQSTDFFDPFLKVQKLFAQLINTPDPNRIVLIPSSSYGMANAANNVDLQAGENIVILDEQFPSNYYIWERVAKEKGAHLKIVGNPDKTRPSGELWNERILNAIDRSTKVVAIGSVHWADGTMFDHKAIRKRTEEVGAYLIIDGTQSVGALPFDVEEIKPDALICSTYKWMFSPYGTGLGYYGPRFDHGLPIEESWMNRKDSHLFEKLVDYEPAYKSGAMRYMVGQSSNFITLPMLEACLEQLLAWGVSDIQSYVQSIGINSLELVKEAGGILATPENRAHHLFGIYLSDEIDKHKLRQELKDRKVIVSFRGNSIRVSPHLYNEAGDFEKIAECMRAARTSLKGSTDLQMR